MRKKKTLIERLKKFEKNKPHYSKSWVEYDYQKALGEPRFNEIRVWANKRQIKPCVRTHD